MGREGVMRMGRGRRRSSYSEVCVSWGVSMYIVMMMIEKVKVYFKVHLL